MIVDFHTHLDSHWFQQPLMEVDAFVAALDQSGVDRACVFTLMGFYEDSARHNDALAARAAQHPERLIPFVTVDPKLGPAAVTELERCLANPSFRGVKFHNWLQAVAPSMVADTMAGIFEVTARYRVPVLFHDGTPPYSTTFQIADLARQSPEATVVLGHAGLADYVPAAAELMRELPNLYACFCGPKAGDLRYLLDATGTERVLFGSDFGFGDLKMLEERLDDVRYANISEADRRAVLGENALRLLKLDD